MNDQRDWQIYSYADYVRMFDLDAADLKRKILDYQALFSSFNAEATQHGSEVTSWDTLYVEELPALQQTWHNILSQQPQLQAADVIAEQFFTDYPQGKKAGRYVAQHEDSIPFKRNQFELILATQRFASMIHDTAAVINELNQLLTLGHELRIFPQAKNNAELAAMLPQALLYFQQHDFGVEIKHNTMLRIWSRQCEVSSP